MKSNSKVSFAKDVETGHPIETTVKDMIQSRILWEGDSGSGKSHGMTCMIEETQDKAQRIIIDPEGEYFTLKDNFPFLLVGRKTEIIKPNVELNLNDVYVDKLIKKIIEKSIDTIIDLSEFPNEATHFFKIFKMAIFKYAKLMKRPLLIFVDESQLFAPEKGQGNEESLKAMMELAKQGRKRGIGLICGTQAIADFSKNVVRQLRTRFIGNCTYDNDIKAAAHTLGFGKEREPELKELSEDHQFFVAAIGGHITINGKKPKSVLKIKCNNTKTKLYDFDFDNEKKFKEKDAQTLSNIALEFSDIPQEINEELTEKERLQKDNIENRKLINELKIKVSQLERQQPRQDPDALAKSYQKGYDDAVRKTRIENEKEKIKSDSLIRSLIPIFQRISHVGKEFSDFDKVISDLRASLESKAFTSLNLPPKIPIQKIEIQQQKDNIKQRLDIPYNILHEAKASVNIDKGNLQTISDSSQNPKLRDGAMRMLKAVAQFDPKPISRNQIGTLSGISAGSPTFSTYISELKRLGWINESNGIVTITSEGLNNAGTIDPLPTDTDTLLSMWSNKFRDGCKRMLKEIVSVYPDSISKEELKQRSNVLSNPTFSTYKSELERNGLIKTNGDSIKATKELFPDF